MGGLNSAVELSSAKTPTPNLEIFVGPVNSTLEFLEARTPAVIQSFFSSPIAIASCTATLIIVWDPEVPLNSQTELSVITAIAPFKGASSTLETACKFTNSAWELSDMAILGKLYVFPGEAPWFVIASAWSCPPQNPKLVA